MKMRLLFALLCCFFINPGYANNGCMARVYPVQEITIYRNLMDWPEHTIHYPMVGSFLISDTP